MSNYPDNVRASDPAAPWNQDYCEGPTWYEVDEYKADLGLAQELLNDLEQVLTRLDNAYPEPGRETVADRGYSFFSMHKKDLPLRVIIGWLRGQLNELADRVAEMEVLE